MTAPGRAPAAGQAPRQAGATGTLSDPGVLLTAWEEASVVPPPARAAVLVHRAGLTPDLDTALDLDVGSCASLAVRAHGAAFGRHVRGITVCASCGATLETEIELPDPGAPVPTGPAAAADPQGGVVRVGALTVRAPTTRDLLSVVAGPPADACSALLSRCVRHADGSPVTAADLPPDVAAAVDAAAERLAGLAALNMRMACSTCGEGVQVALDPGALLWDQVDAAAPLLLSQVVALAAAFGWSEGDVLAMAPARRAAYLAHVAQVTQ